jgi:hypothetical protein
MRTTQKDFDIFKVEFLKWIKFFGLNDIHFNFVYVEHENYAQVIGDHNQKAYVVFFSKEFADMKKLPKGFVKYLGYHEACECLLYRIRTIATNRTFNEDELDSEIHSVINRLEKVLIDGGCFFNVEPEINI